MIKTFNQAVKFLEGYIPSPEKKHPGELGLRRMQFLMDLLGSPQFTYPTVHVGGTSGKGSTATIIASILATKYNVGLHTSPHLVRINERIKVLGPTFFSSFWQARNERAQNRFWTSQNDIRIDIPDDEFVALANEIFPTIKKVEKSKLGKPSYFEIVTAMAFLYFNKPKVDFAVIEVGMGGKYDATNVIKPLVAVLTNVGLDHTQVLGDTVEKIARDKVGIIKPGVSVVSGVKQSSVVTIVNTRIQEYKNTKLLILGKDFSFRIKEMNAEGSIFDYSGDHAYKDLSLSLLGEHQVENAALAIKAIELLCKTSPLPSPSRRGDYGVRLINDDYMRKALRSVYIPGRLETVKKNPLVILDGAHNPEKMKALVKGIKDIFPQKRVISILAIKSEKNAKEMLSLLLPICNKLILTKFRLTTDLGDTFSYEPEKLVEYVKGSRLRSNNINVINNPQIALEEAMKQVGRDDLILVTGSLYLVGELRKFLISTS